VELDEHEFLDVVKYLVEVQVLHAYAFVYILAASMLSINISIHLTFLMTFLKLIITFL